MSYRVFISASTQKENVGVSNYGNEQDRMMCLADRVKYWLDTQGGKFKVFRNQHGWSLSQTVQACNTMQCELFVDNHTNAGPAKASGTEVFYNHNDPKGKGYRIATMLYNEIAPLSPGKDRGILPDNKYVKSLFVIQQTAPPATLVEHIFHTNTEEVKDFLSRMDDYAKAEAKAIVQYFDEKWIEPIKSSDSIEFLVDILEKCEIISDKKYWKDVLYGNISVKPEWLQVAFRRAIIKFERYELK